MIERHCQGWHGGFLLQVDLTVWSLAGSVRFQPQGLESFFPDNMYKEGVGAILDSYGEEYDSLTILLVLESSFWLDTAPSRLETLFLRRATWGEYRGIRQDVVDESLPLSELWPLPQKKMIDGVISSLACVLEALSWSDIAALIPSDECSPEDKLLGFEGEDGCSDSMEGLDWYHLYFFSKKCKHRTVM